MLTNTVDCCYGVHEHKYEQLYYNKVSTVSAAELKTEVFIQASRRLLILCLVTVQLKWTVKDTHKAKTLLQFVEYQNENMVQKSQGHSFFIGERIAAQFTIDPQTRFSIVHKKVWGCVHAVNCLHIIYHNITTKRDTHLIHISPRHDRYKAFSLQRRQNSCLNSQCACFQAWDLYLQKRIEASVKNWLKG